LEVKSSADWVRMTREALRAARFVRVAAGENVYWTAGRGDRPFVLVHGVNDQAGTWVAVAAALAMRTQVVLPDLPGHGESGPAEGPIAVDALVAGLAAVIDDATAGPVRLVGNSLGGWVSTLYALTYPERVGHLVLEGAGGLSTPFAVPVVARTVEEARVVLRAVHGPGYEAPGWLLESLVERGEASVMLRITGVAERFLDDRLRDVAVPVTLIWGEQDGILPLSYAEQMRTGLGNPPLHVIAGAAHIPHLQKPAEVLACLMAIS
jgi:pimeloyl-ACP methyl ester carboxylesterase